MNSTTIVDEVEQEGYTGLTEPMLDSVLQELYGRRRWNFLRREVEGPAANLFVSPANEGEAWLVSLWNATHGASFKIDQVYLTNGTEYYEVKEIGPAKIEKLRHLDREPGVPIYWSRVAHSPTESEGDVQGYLHVWPFPDRQYNLKIIYHIIPSTPSFFGNNDVFWPSEHKGVIVEEILIRLARRQRDWNAFDRAQARAKEAYLAAVSDDNRLSEQTDDQVEEWEGWHNAGLA